MTAERTAWVQERSPRPPRGAPGAPPRSSAAGVVSPAPTRAPTTPRHLFQLPAPPAPAAKTPRTDRPNVSCCRLRWPPALSRIPRTRPGSSLDLSWHAPAAPLAVKRRAGCWCFYLARLGRLQISVGFIGTGPHTKHPSVRPQNHGSRERARVPVVWHVRCDRRHVRCHFAPCRSRLR